MSRTARLGAFILGTFAILAVGIFIIGGKQYLFTSTYVLKTSFANVAGLQAGADVMVGGLHSGAVNSIALPEKPGEPLTVVMELDQSTHKILRQDSEASIQTEGLLGNQYVAVSFGSPDKPDVKDGDTIASVPPLEMAALLDKANGLLAQGQSAMVNINQVAEHLKSVSAKIDNGNGTVGALVNDKALYNNLDKTASSARSAVNSADVGIKDFQDNMEALKHNFLLKGYFKTRGYEDSADNDQGLHLPGKRSFRQAGFRQAQGPKSSQRRWRVSRRERLWSCGNSGIHWKDRQRCYRPYSCASQGDGGARLHRATLWL
jgi:phospholipid/cholesterol/gamma-HCH transport system substrate-binding protein